MHPPSIAGQYGLVKSHPNAIYRHFASTQFVLDRGTYHCEEKALHSLLVDQQVKQQERFASLLAHSIGLQSEGSWDSQGPTVTDIFRNMFCSFIYFEKCVCQKHAPLSPFPVSRCIPDPK